MIVQSTCVNHTTIDGEYDISVIETERGVYSAFCNREGYPPRYLFKVKNIKVDNRYVNNFEEMQKDRTKTVVDLAKNFLEKEKYKKYNNYQLSEQI
tara:strand:- start:69 stop:356 length:288 start_codon:yes stop_codon:yes gene_type:complete